MIRMVRMVRTATVLAMISRHTRTRIHICIRTRMLLRTRIRVRVMFHALPMVAALLCTRGHPMSPSVHAVRRRGGTGIHRTMRVMLVPRVIRMPGACAWGRSGIPRSDRTRIPSRRERGVALVRAVVRAFRAHGIPQVLRCMPVRRTVAGVRTAVRSPRCALSIRTLAQHRAGCRPHRLVRARYARIGRRRLHRRAGRQRGDPCQHAHSRTSTSRIIPDSMW
jgi:hypothetical protein